MAILRGAADGAVPWIKDDQFVDVEGYIAANNAFHETLVALADNPSLLAAYRRLALPTVMSQALHGVHATLDRFTADLVAIAECLAAGDVEGGAVARSRAHRGRQSADEYRRHRTWWKVLMSGICRVSPPTIIRRPAMSDHLYRVTEIVGTSSDGVEGAIVSGIERAAETVRELDWFEVTKIRGHVSDGRVEHYQVGLKIGFRIEG